MAEQRVQRRLAAILAADVVGYSRLMGEDEEGTLVDLNENRGVIDQLIGEHDGRIFGSAGDSLIAEFASPVEAVRCAVAIQLELDTRNVELPAPQRMRLRIGINFGDVMVEGDNLMGDVVNIAARLESLALPGGLCLSESVLDLVRDRLDLEFVDAGTHAVKNIARPVQVYRVPLSSEDQLTSPFRGLETFEIADADLFFGRTRAISETKSRLEQQALAGNAFLLIYGMSGTGKSSLMRAGLLPAITAPGAVAGIELWRHCLMRPSGDLFDVLANSLVERGALPELCAETGLGALSELLRTSPDQALARIRSALGVAAEANGSAPQLVRLLIAIDQMEEMFTSEGIDDAARDEFVRLLATLAGSGIVWIVGTIRSDFFHRCGEVNGFSALKDGLGSYELLPPTGAEIAQIIREPARLAGLKFEEDPQQGHLEDVLQQAAVQDTGSLPLLEFVLDALYEAGKEHRILNFATYRALGGLEGAIAQRADEVTASLPPEVQDALPSALRALTTFHQQDETTTSRLVPHSQIAHTDAQASLIDALIDARLLVSDQGIEGVPMVRLAHEALLSQWPRAREIVTANREFLQTRARVRPDALRWLEDGRPPDLLLPSGKRVAEAEDVLLSRRDEIDEETAEYIDASIAAHRSREAAEREAENERLKAEEAARRERLEIENVAALQRESAARRLARRTRIAALVTLVLAVAAGAGAIVGFQGQQEATRQAELAENNAAQARAAEQVAESQAQAALTARDTALRNQSLFLADLSLQQTTAGDTTAGILLAMEALPGDLDNPDRPFVNEAAAALYQAVLSRREISLLRGHQKTVTHAAFSPDGERIVTSSRDGTARVWDVATGAELVALRDHDRDVQHAVFSHDGRKILTASWDATARVWDAKNGKIIAVLRGHDATVFHAVFSPNEELIATASTDGTARIWDAKSGAELAVLRGHNAQVQHVAFSPGGDRLITASVDGTARLWDIETAVELAVFKGATSPGAHFGRATTAAINAAFSPNGEQLVTALRGVEADLWDTTTGERIASLRGHSRGVQNAAFSLDGRLIASASWDHTARIWNADNGAIEAVLRGHEGPLFSALFSPDGTRLVTTSSDGTARLWESATGAPDAVLRGHEDTVFFAAFSPDGTRIVTTSTDGTARIWDAIGGTALRRQDGAILHAEFAPNGERVITAAANGTTRIWNSHNGTEIALLGGHKAGILHATFSPTGGRILTSSADNTARLWDINGKSISLLKGHEDDINQAAFSPDGATIATASRDGTARLWSTADDSPNTVLKGHQKSVNHIAFNAQGNLIVTASSDATARIWNASTGEEVSTLRGHDRKVELAVFNRSGDLVLTASEDLTARIWNVDDSSELATLRGHGAKVTRAAFSPDGNTVVTASPDRTARVWESATGKELLVLRGHEGRVNDAVYSPNGERIATVSQDGTARLWDTKNGAQLAVFRGHDDEISRISFSPDGNRLITSSDDGTSRIFRNFPSTAALVDHARSVVPRQLTLCDRVRFFLDAGEDAVSCEK